MADFVEFSEGVADDFGEAGDDAEVRKEAFRRDAVVFLIDGRESMFHAAAVEAREDGSATGHSPFSNAVKCALTFYQDKVITSDKDLVGLVIYNAKQHLNVYEFPHVYVFHEMDNPSAPRVQELDCLARCGVKGVVGYNNFVQTIGHCPATEKAPLSEALWAAQHMMNHTPKSVATKRIFVFTNDENPPRDDGVERDRCFARMKDLYEANVQLEVWAHGFNPSGAVGGGASDASDASVTASAATASVSGGTGPSSSSAAGTIGSNSGTDGATLLSYTPPRSTDIRSDVSAANGDKGLPQKTPKREAPRPQPGVTTFNSDSFWNRLLAIPRTYHGLTASRRGQEQIPQQQQQQQSTDSDPFGYLAPLSASSGGLSSGGLGVDSGGAYTGRVHIADFSNAATFTTILESVRERIWTQRTTGRLELSVGTGGLVPKVAVNVFLPVMRCKKPSFTWVEASTNAVVTSETRLVLRETGTEVAPSEIISAVRIGDNEVKFTKEEVALMKGQFGAKGLQILGFKDKSALKFKHSISRAAFIHPVTDESENAESIKFFVQLHRTLAAQNRVAIAQLIARPGSAPRLVALVPNVDQRDESVLGTGLHVVHIPYFDDIRSVRVNDPKNPRRVVGSSDELVVKAKKIIRELTNDTHDFKAVENPVLQRQYHVLQQLALCDESRPVPPDATLPDKEGMSRPKVKKLFADFRESAFPPGYSPEAFCPQPKPAKPPPSSTELEQINFDQLERNGAVASLTIPFLKEYLKQNHVDASKAKLKADYVVLVSAHVRQKRGEGGERTGGSQSGGDGFKVKEEESYGALF